MINFKTKQNSARSSIRRGFLLPTAHLPLPSAHCFLILGMFLLATLPALAQRPTISDRPLSDRRVAYDIVINLDPEQRMLRGTERVVWRNPDRVPVDELQFHLYLNAFKNERSTFMRESGGELRSLAAEGEDRWGWIDIKQMRVEGAAEAEADVTNALQFVHPDDDNRDDQTVAAVRLPRPVPPGGSVTLDVAFEARLPKVFARTGWSETDNRRLFFMVAQWFPKLGVYEVPGQRYVPPDAPRGMWNTHQFHANSEFYADYGTYRVEITTPADYTVGASGVRTSERTANGQRTVEYRAEDVHDFAWTASNDFREFTDQWRHVELRLLVQPAHSYQAARHFAAAKTALQYFNDWYGEYPYTTLTLVDGIGGSNGMEYPTLITCGTVYMLPARLRVLELVTIHEFGHQYWYGLLGSNEFEEAWLDEGINSYTEARIMDAAYGAGSSVIDLAGLRFGDGQMQRVLYAKSEPTRVVMFARAWDYPFEDYAEASYAKPATVLATLERHVGPEVMGRIMRAYYERWRFRHPTTKDFIQTAEEVSGQSLGWFFDQFVYGTVAVDYAVDRIVNEELPAHAEGIYQENDQRIRVGEDGKRFSWPDGRELGPANQTASQSSDVYRSEVWVERRQAGIFPQTLLVRFSDGSTELVEWDGQEQWKKFAYEKPARIVEAHLDPGNKVWLDIERLNNRRVAAADNSFAREHQLKFIVWLQQLFFAVAGLA